MPPIQAARGPSLKTFVIFCPWPAEEPRVPCASFVSGETLFLCSYDALLLQMKCNLFRF